MSAEMSPASWDDIRRFADESYAAANEMEDSRFAAVVFPLVDAIRRMARLLEESEKLMQSLVGVDESPFDETPDVAERVLPGPYRLDPATGNAFRLEYEVPGRRRFDHPEFSTPERVVVTDPTGAREMSISRAEWNTWEEASTDESPKSLGEAA